VAGPNGAGKTTLAAEEFILGEVVVNADEIARSLPSASPLEAGRLAIRERRRCLTSRTSFAIETTLSGRRELDLIRDARERGFMVALHYIGVESPELCRIRVDERVTKGGHDVPHADLVRRYHRSASNLVSAIALAHVAFVYDNSTRQGIKPVARFAGAALLECAPEVPRWMERALGSLLRR
jgi:predicted ABC-type ATPase